MSMSIFGSLMGNFDEDQFFRSAMRDMGSMNQMMNSMLQDPFRISDMFRNFDNSRSVAMHPYMLNPFGMMPNFNRLMNDSLNPIEGPMGGCNYSSSSTVISMTSGPDGKPQVYKATSSTKVGPGGVKETQRTVSDTMTGTKKMAIGHHIGERAHIIEKEQNMRTGDREERQDFINLDEDEAEDFNREWQSKTRSASDLSRLGGNRNRHGYGGGYPALPAITAGPSSAQSMRSTVPLATGRRSIRQDEVPVRSSHYSSTQRTPYSAPGQERPRKSKNIKIVSGSNQEK